MSLLVDYHIRNKWKSRSMYHLVDEQMIRSAHTNEVVICMYCNVRCMMYHRAFFYFNSFLLLFCWWIEIQKKRAKKWVTKHARICLLLLEYSTIYSIFYGLLWTAVSLSLCLWTRISSACMHECMRMWIQH